MKVFGYELYIGRNTTTTKRKRDLIEFDKVTELDFEISTKGWRVVISKIP